MDYRLELKVKNNHLLTMMEAHKINTAAELYRQSGVDQSSIGQILNLKIPAYNKDGDINPSVMRLCAFFNCCPSDIFPESNLEEALSQNKFSGIVSRKELERLSESSVDPLSVIENISAASEIHKILQSSNLSAREQEVIHRRFGLKQSDPETLESIAVDLKISKGRIREIEQKALRKMRKPNISGRFIAGGLYGGYKNRR